MSIFDRPSFQTYYSSVDQMVSRLLDRERTEYLLTVDFARYRDHLVSELEWQPLEWDESQMTVEPFTIKAERPRLAESRARELVTFSTSLPLGS